MAAKRELIEPTPGDKRYVRRDDEGNFRRRQRNQVRNGYSAKQSRWTSRFMTGTGGERFIGRRLKAL